MFSEGSQKLYSVINSKHHRGAGVFDWLV